MPSPQRFEVAESAPAKRAPKPGRRRGEGGRREEILVAAVGPLNRHGLRGMTLAMVGEGLGLAPTAVGYYFRRKEDLAAACYLESIRKLQSLADEASRSGADGPRALIQAVFDFRSAVERGQEREIAWFEDVRTIHHPDVDAAYTEFFRRVRELFGPAEDRRSRIARNLRTHMLLSQIYWAVGWLPQYHPHDYPRMAERTLDILEHGLAADDRPWSPTALSPSLGEESDEAGQMFLRAATELINERGYLGASVQKIAERLNLTKGAFYHHHDTKNDLVAQCFERSWRIVAEVQATADASTRDGYANLASVAAFIVGRQFTQETPLLRAAALAAAPTELRGELVAGFTRTAHRFASVLCDGIVDGSVRPHEVTVGSQIVSGAINAATELRFWAPGAEPAEAAELYLAPLFTGLFRKP